MKETNPNEDVMFKDKSGNIDIRALLTGVVQKLLGTALDYSRISGMSDRSFNQMQRSLKDSYYKILDFTLKELEKTGYLQKKDPSDENTL